MTIRIKAVDKVEILTLQDNYIDLLSQDNSSIVQRAVPLKGMEISNSVLAEHGFSSLIHVTKDEKTRTMLFDFGFSNDGAAFNAGALSADLSKVEVMALSHGHLDHVGGLEKLVSATGKKKIELVLHPAAFKNPRLLKITEDFKLTFPAFTRSGAASAGVTLVETEDPYPLLGGRAIFLGGIPRITNFEKGAPNLIYEEDGVEKQDLFEDDSSMFFYVKDKGLVVLSGCSHAGIINTVMHAKKISGVNKVLAVMGGFHLSGADFDSVVQPTIEGLKEINPEYIIPTHCTGRQAITSIEREMPEKFILNMSGTKLTF